MPAALLSTVGVVVSALLTGVAAYALFDLSWLESVLLGAVVASTDAAAVFATLRFTHIRRTLARTLEAESGGNDPMAIALTLGLIAWIEQPDSYGIDDLALLVVQQIGLGLLVGVALGAAAIWVFARLPHSIGAFAPVASVAAGALSFGAADVIGGSGFLAVYLVGLAVGSTPSRYRRQLVALPRRARVPRAGRDLHRARPARLPERAAGRGAAGPRARVAADARDPAGRGLGVDGASATSRHRERLLLGWAGLRGAVPIVLATFVLSSDVPHADTIFNAVFFVVVVSTIVQGTTLEWVAGRLGLLSPAPPRPRAAARGRRR